MEIEPNNHVDFKGSEMNDVEIGADQLMSVRRKSGMFGKKFPSLQVNHYPVLLLSNSTDQFSSHPSVTWKTSTQSEYSDSTRDLTVKNMPKRKISIEQTSLSAKNSLDLRDRPRFVRNLTTSILSPTNENPTSQIGQSCVPSNRLHASPKVSFSSVVQQSMRRQALGGMGSGRCLSSASPISAAERQQLWGSSMHHSFDERPSASTEDLYASCNDIDQAYRQQRKRRAGISGGSTNIQRDMPFACSGGNGYSSAGVSNGRGCPSLGGRSAQSSFDSNQDVAQISMNWMRMNGLGPSFRPFLNGNHTPKKSVIKNSQSSTQISRIGSLRRMHAADVSIDGKLSLADVSAVCTAVTPVQAEKAKKSCRDHHTNKILFEFSPNVLFTKTPRSMPPSDVPIRAATQSSSSSNLGDTNDADTPHAPKSILRTPRLTTTPKQLSFDVPPSPTPTPKNSCVSASGSYHMFERPARSRSAKLSYTHTNTTPPNGHITVTPNGTPVFAYTRTMGSPNATVRRDPSKWRLSELKQRSNSESMFRTNHTNGLVNGGRRMSMAYLPSREQALLRRILGPQGLSWISTDRETASRKSVSIAYSNDLEGGKGGGDDSTIPLMDEKDENSGGRLIKREYLHEKRRMVCDKALALAIMGIILMIIENEMRSSNLIRPGSPFSLGIKFCIVGTTVALLSFVGYFHVIEIQLFMNANAADDWMVALTFGRISQIITELCICMLCPLPVELFTPFANERSYGKTLHAINVFLSIMMFFRLYWLCRVMLLHSRLFTDASSRSIAGLNRVNFNARFILKTLMTLSPGTMLMIFTASLWIIAGWILRLCEREYLSPDQRKDMDYINSIWLVAITFLSVGYGDIVPKTYCGRSMAVITGIMGTCASSMVVAVIARKLELTRAEKHVHNFMQDTQLTKQLKHSAANVLRETWFIYKYRKLMDHCDFGKVRQHQRKFLLAIYDMRRVKRDQRKLAENLVSLGDVAKTSSNTYELVHDVHSTQEGLSLRITAIEHQLSDISRELSSLVELLRGNEHRPGSTVNGQEDSPPIYRIRRKFGELRI